MRRIVKFSIRYQPIEGYNSENSTPKKYSIISMELRASIKYKIIVLFGSYETTDISCRISTSNQVQVHDLIHAPEG